MSQRRSSRSSVKPRAAALSAPSSARRLAPTRQTRTSRLCRPRWSRHLASAISKRSRNSPSRGKELVMPSPTIVLVHGAFADASCWRPVFDRLVDDGHTVLAPPNPLRGLPYDASYTASVIDQLDGPVVLVGHSYGGAVITVAGGSDKVAGLVYVCADVPDADAAFMAISQRPVSATAFDDPATAAAWRAKPSWAVFGTADYPVAPELHRFSYDRAGSTVTEVEGASHFLMRSQPDIVAGVIREAVVASAVNRAA